MSLILNDQTTNGNNLTNHNAVSDITTSLISGFTGDTDAAGLASASSQSLQVTSASSSLSMASDLSIESWVKFTSTPSSGNSMHIFANWYDTENHYLFSLFNNSGTLQLRGFVSNGSTNDSLANNWTPTTSKWYYVAFTWKASSKTLTLYTGDETTSPSQLGTTTGTNVSSMPTNARNPVIGSGNLTSSTTTSDYLNGVINEVRVWNIQRQLSDLQSNYKQHLSGSQPVGLVAYWPFETVTFSSSSTGGFFNFM